MNERVNYLFVADKQTQACGRYASDGAVDGPGVVFRCSSAVRHFTLEGGEYGKFTYRAVKMHCHE